MGLTIEVKEFKNTLKNIRWITLTLFLQFTIMPLLALILSVILKLPLEISLGFIILGSCPGGTASNVIAYLCNGNVTLSLLCTLVSTVFAIFLTPLLILLCAGQTIEIPVVELISSTSKIILIPLSMGLLIKFYFYDYIEKINFFFPTISEVTVALIISIIFAINFENFNFMTYKILVGVIFHNLSGLIIGYFVAHYFKIPLKEKKTIAIEVGMQNSGLGMGLALVHFNNLVALPSAIFSIWHNISASVLVYLSKKK
jgi:BASS family bile acid:Na+ symporter